MKPNALTIPHYYAIRGPALARLAIVKRTRLIVSPPFRGGYTSHEAAQHCRDHYASEAGSRMRMLRLRPPTDPCPECLEPQAHTRLGPCPKCQKKENARNDARKAEKQAEQAKRGTFGDAANKWRTIHAASKVIADVRAECGVPRSDPR